MDNLIYNNMTLSDETFLRFIAYVWVIIGMKIPKSKKEIMRSYLLKRLKSLGINSFDEYFEYVFNSWGNAEELSSLVNILTSDKAEVD